MENLKWGEIPQCPYCNSKKYRILLEGRYQCNECYTSYTVTVGTIFHKTRIDLEKWYIAIPLIIKKDPISSRKLSNKIDVNKNTANRMIAIIKKAYLNKDELLINILEYDK